MMSEAKEIKNDSVKEDGKPTFLFWIVSVLAIVWGAFGLIDYYLITTGNSEYIAQLPEKIQSNG